MPYPTRSCAVIDFYTSVVCHVIQREYRNNMVKNDVDGGSRVKFFDTEVVIKKPESSLCLGKAYHYFDVVSISVVEFKDKHCNDDQPLVFSIKVFGKDGNDVKLYKQLTTIVPNDWNINLFAICLCEVVMKQSNTLFIYLSPEKDDSIEDISGLNLLYKESTSKLIFDSYSSLAQSFVDGGKYR